MKITLINCSCILMLVSSFFVVSSRNPLHSIIFLVSSFVFSSIIIFSLGNEFFALFFLIVYLGAIVVLFLFVVMMLDIKHNELRINRLHFPTGVFISLALFYVIIHPLRSVFADSVNIPDLLVNVYTNWFITMESTTDITTIAQVFYEDYAAQILIVGFILYIAVLGVIFMTVKKYNKDLYKKHQSTIRQLARRNIL